jgi:hypothetical protein
LKEIQEVSILGWTWVPGSLRGQSQNSRALNNGKADRSLFLTACKTRSGMLSIDVQSAGRRDRSNDQPIVSIVHDRNDRSNCEPIARQGLLFVMRISILK